MGIDDGFCQHAAVKGMALAYHPAFNHDDGRVQPRLSNSFHHSLSHSRTSSATGTPASSVSTVSMMISRASEHSPQGIY